MDWAEKGVAGPTMADRFVAKTGLLRREGERSESRSRKVLGFRARECVQGAGANPQHDVTETKEGAGGWGERGLPKYSPG